MPYKNPKPCKYPGCPGLTSGGYCDLHASLDRKRYAEYKLNPNTNAVYDRRWRSVRGLYISRHPLCELCLENGRYIPAQEVHHRLPVTQGGTHAEENLQALCTSCHSRISRSSPKAEYTFPGR